MGDMFAYVKYLKDDVRAIVHVSKIVNFTPISAKDFSKHKVYMTFWSANEEERVTKGQTGEMKENYYKSQILVMADTTEELKNIIAANRVPVAKIRNLSDHENDSEDEPLVKKKKGNRMAQAEKKMKAAAAGEEKCKAILAERKRELLRSPLMPSRKSFTECSSDSDSEDEVVPKKLLLDSEAKYHRLKKNFLELKKREEENQKVVEEWKLFKGKVEALEEENKILKRFNFQLQEEVIQHFKSGTTMEALDKQSASKEMPDVTTEEDLIAEDGYVHLGKNVRIQQEKWDVISKNTKDSLFIKDLAVVVWGTEHLKGRSLDGIPCNRLKSQGAVSKPPLTPEKLSAIKGKFKDWLGEKGVEEEEINNRAKKIKSYISDKIMYLNRKEKKNLTNNTGLQ